MRAALRAALRGSGKVSPNPLVGAAMEAGFPVAASESNSPPAAFRLGVMPSASHLRFGGPHAEPLLLSRTGDAARGATIHVTLEPCAHRGKTGPCADRLIAAGVSKVVIATLDPNPRVRGRGADRLREAGIEVEIGPGAREALAINLPYFTNHLYGRAWIELKEAISLDGRVADEEGGSRWITGEASRREVHRQRGAADALVVGSGTIATDDPELTVRDAPGSTPTRIVIDSELRTSPNARIWQAWRAQSQREPAGVTRISPESNTDGSGNDRARAGLGNFERSVDGSYVRSPRLVLATAESAPADRLEPYRAQGWEIWFLPQERGHVSLSGFAQRAAHEGFNHLLVEAGPGLAQGFLEADLVDALTIYLAPRMLGGRHSWTGAFLDSVSHAPAMETVQLRAVGLDACWRLRRVGIVETMENKVRDLG